MDSGTPKVEGGRVEFLIEGGILLGLLPDQVNDNV